MYPFSFDLGNVARVRSPQPTWPNNYGPFSESYGIERIAGEARIEWISAKLKPPRSREHTQSGLIFVMLVHQFFVYPQELISK